MNKMVRKCWRLDWIQTTISVVFYISLLQKKFNVFFTNISKLSLGKFTYVVAFYKIFFLAFPLFIIDNLAENMEQPTYEEFVKGFGEHDMQDMLKSQFELIAKTGIAAVMELVMNDPSLTLEEVADRLGYNGNV